MEITTEDLPALARGAAFLGTGGGGDPYIGQLLAKSAVQEFGAPKVINAKDLDDEAVVLTIAMLGAPTVLKEKAACGDDIDHAIQQMESTLGQKADAIMPIEIGGVNSMIPIVAAARTGLPLVDADGMGRAFPEIQMVTFNVYEVSCAPVVIVDEHLNSVVVNTQGAKRAEDLVRVTSVEMGCSVIISSYSMTGKQAKECAVHGTLALALGIGKSIKSGRSAGDPVGTLCNFLRSTSYYNQCKVIFDGKVKDLLRDTKDGFAIGHCYLESIDKSEPDLEVIFQNEHLVARQAGALKAIVPDLICMIDRETAEPIPVESLKYGQRIKVLGVSAAPIMRTPASLAIFGPKAFGLEHDFVAIEKL